MKQTPNFRFGKASSQRLITCHNDLRIFACVAIATSPVDLTIVCGTRGEAAQEAAFNDGYSRAHYGESPHNFTPSRAVDIAPYVDGKIIWDGNHPAFAQLIDHLEKTAKQLYDDGSIENHIESAWINWGWDPVHWQIRGWKSLK